MQERRRRGRTPGIHIQIGRRYKHADLTRSHRSARSKREATLMHTGLVAVQERYASLLDAEMMQALHDAVVRLIRPHVKASWSDEEARGKALEIARELLDEPLPEG